MKNTITLLMIFFFAASISIAQNVENLDKTMSLGKQPAVYVEIEGADEDMAKDVWEDYVEDYGKTKRNKKAKEYYTQDARIPVLSSDGKVTLYMKFEEGRDLTTAYLWVEAANSFIDNSEGLDNFMQDYYEMVRKVVVNKEIEEQEDVLKDLGKDMEKLVKKNKGYHEDISEAEEKIRKAEENIEINLNEQDQMNAEIARQKETLEMIIEKLNNIGKEGK